MMDPWEIEAGLAPRERAVVLLSRGLRSIRMAADEILRARGRTWCSSPRPGSAVPPAG